MIYTVTFNPALDYTMELNTINFGRVNRTRAEHITAGGKGINVSTVLHNLGIKSTALGFVAGFTGKYIEDSLNANGIDSDFVHLKNGLTRINVKILSQTSDSCTTGETTDINAKGPEISSQDLDEFYKKIDKLNSEDILILSGAIPPSLPGNTYSEIIKRLNSKNIRVVVDAAGELLINTLAFKPFLIKPNIDELQAIFSAKCTSDEEVIALAKKLQEQGAQNVLVSLGERGALLLGSDNTIYKCDAPAGTPQSTVGAGDSMVAGYLCALVNMSSTPLNPLCLAVAAGSATVFSQDLADKDTIMSLYEITQSTVLHR